MEVPYRQLSPEEIVKLNNNNCSSESWDLVQVKEGFDPRFVRNSLFSGDVKLGVFSKNFELEGGLKKHAGIYKAIIHNCTVGDEVLIENIHDYIANYNIGDGSFIQNINTLVVTDKNSFGNGTRVSVLDETGGRNIAIYNELSAHFAYAYVSYRYRPNLIAAMDCIVEKYTEELSSERGTIGKNVVIKNAGYLKNVHIGDFTHIEGASRLSNGSINSNKNAPIYVGCQVVASDFILSSGSSLDEGAIISRCFVGQACKIGHAYSASDSLFFSNCQGENGEACSIFAGPYTVTHHKSTLLIAGMFSFMNAGSGSNQSNHMYKLGPIHQGIVERGSKTTSNSYVLWPAHIGAFSLIMGRHYKHLDTSMMPFSYIIERNDESYLAPAVNLRTVGTSRDFMKWAKRDARKDPKKLDFIHFSLFNPFSIGKVLDGIEKLNTIQEQQGYDTALYNYNGCKITHDSLLKGLKFYELAVKKYFGNCLIKRLENGLTLSTHIIQGTGTWIDLSGLIAPKSKAEIIFSGIEHRQLTTSSQIHEQFEKLHEQFDEHEWNWAYNKMKHYYKLDETQNKANVQLILSHWLEASTELDELILADAKKEFKRLSMVGFGLDGVENDKVTDLDAVRGTYENNAFILQINKQILEYQKIHQIYIQSLEE